MTLKSTNIEASNQARVTVPRGVQEIDHAVAAAAAPILRGSTDHFTVSYDSALGDDGITLSDAILARCESDYATLQDYFGGITPPNLPFKVLVTTGGTGASHFGCAGSNCLSGAGRRRVSTRTSSCHWWWPRWMKCSRPRPG